MLALEALKKALGSAGRTDFDTRGPGDLSWPVERIAVFVDDCLSFGCPRHTRKSNENWKRRARVNRRRAAKSDKDLKAREWFVFRFWEHEVLETPQDVVGEIIQAFADIREPPDAVAVSLIAQAANLDGAYRVGDQSWIHFLRYVSKMAQNFRRADFRLVLVDREGWSPVTFREAWRTALHHRIITSNNSGCHPGPLLNPVLKDLGIRRREESRRA